MTLSERFDRVLLWLTAVQHNLRSFAVLRILYGIGLLLTVVPSIPERSLLWGAASFWVDPEAKRRGYVTFDVLLSKSSPILFDIVFFAFIAIILLFTLGYRTRIVTPVMLVLLISLQSNNPYLLNGGDTIYRITLLFLMFVNLSAHYSLDAWLAKRRKPAKRERRRWVPDYISNAAHNTALVLCCFQIIVVYVVSGIWKLLGDEWLGGTALFYALRIDSFMAYPMINEMLWQSSLLIYVATFIALWVQTLFPFALLWRPARIFVLVSLIFMHSGIGLLLGLWPFSLAMIALDMLFIRDSTWVGMTAWIRSTRAWGYLEENTPRLELKASGRRRVTTPRSAPEAATTAPEAETAPVS